MNMTKLAMAGLLTGAICGGGCAKDEKSTEIVTVKETTAPSTPTASPTTKPTTSVRTSTPAAAATTVPDKDMTHVLTKDEAFYTTSPAQARKPDGMLKAGTKVVLLMPRGSYSQVMTTDGKRVYTSTAALKPVGN